MLQTETSHPNTSDAGVSVDMGNSEHAATELESTAEPERPRSPRLPHMLPSTEAEREAVGLNFTDTSRRPRLRHIPIEYRGEFSSDKSTQTKLSETGDVNKMVKEHRNLKVMIQTARRDLESFAALHKVSHTEQIKRTERAALAEMKRQIETEKQRSMSAVEAAVRVARLEAEQAKEIYRTEMETTMSNRIAVLEAEHAASIASITKRASMLATQVLNLQRANQALKDPKGAGVKGSKMKVVLDTDERDFDDLEDITSVRTKLRVAEGEVASLKLEVEKANEAAQRAAQRAKMVISRAHQVSQQYAREQRTQKAEMMRLENQIARLEHQLYSGPGDLSEVRTDITKQVKAQMAELAAAEAKRQALREKKRLQDLHSKHEHDLLEERARARAEVESVEKNFQLKIAGLQAKHATEIGSVETRWRRKFEVMEAARKSLDSRPSLNTILMAQAKIKEQAAQRYSVEVDDVDSFLPPLNN